MVLPESWGLQPLIPLAHTPVVGVLCLHSAPYVQLSICTCDGCLYCHYLMPVSCLWLVITYHDL